MMTHWNNSLSSLSLPRRRQIWRRRRAYEGRCCPIHWLSSDLGSWCVNQGKLLVASWCGDFGIFFRFVRQRAYEGRCCHIHWLSTDLGSWFVNQEKQLAGSSCGDFGIFFWFVVWFLQPYGLLVKNCKPVLHGVMPQAMLLQRFPRFKRRVAIAVFKPWYGNCRCLCSFVVGSVQFSISKGWRII